MYLIRARDSDALGPIIDDLEAIDDFTHCDLAELNSLELSELTNDSVGWIEGPPVVFDESSGLSIFRFSEAAMAWLCAHADKLVPFGVDGEQLAAFSSKDTDQLLFALDTF